MIESERKSASGINQRIRLIVLGSHQGDPGHQGHTDAEVEADARCGYTLILSKFLTDKRTDRKKLKVFQIILLALFSLYQKNKKISVNSLRQKTT